MKMQTNSTALITGIAGQDGSYLAELLLSKGYRVVGINLPSSPAEPFFSNIAGISDKLELHTGDILDVPFIRKVIEETEPNEIYHLAASSFVNYSPEVEREILSKNISGTHNLLSAFREFVPSARFFFAGTAEMFGQPIHQPQNTSTPFHPRSVYGISKVCGHNLVTYYRNQFGLFAVTGILYNHESPRRGPNFVTQKIAKAVAAIKFGKQGELVLGNLDARRDWGHAKDYVFGFWQQLQYSESRDFIFATGKTHTVREFVDKAFSYVGLNYQNYVRVSEEFYRPTEKIDLVGEVNETKEILGWQSEHSLDDIVIEMMENQLQLLSGIGNNTYG
jgi:GDPmannose 4,6-dehydratase